MAKGLTFGKPIGTPFLCAKEEAAVLGRKKMVGGQRFPLPLGDLCLEAVLHQGMLKWP